MKVSIVKIIGELCGGGREIRTHEGRKPLPVFKTGAFNRSASPPGIYCSVPLPVLASASHWLRQYEPTPQQARKRACWQDWCIQPLCQPSEAAHFELWRAVCPEKC